MFKPSPTFARVPARRIWFFSLIALLATLSLFVLAQDKTTAPAAATPADEQIIKDIQAKLSADKELAGQMTHISVTSNEGAVTLVGWVNTKAQVDRAGTLAGGVAGVNQVINKLGLAPVRTNCGTGQQACAGSCIDESDPCNPSKRG